MKSMKIVCMYESEVTFLFLNNTFVDQTKAALQKVFPS